MKKVLVLSLLTVAVFAWLASCQNEASNQPKFAKTGDPQIDALTEQIFKNPKNAALYFERAKKFYESGLEKGGYDFAIEDMRYALSLDSTNVEYHHFLADVYLDYSQSRLAVATMERAAELAPNNIPTLLKLSEMYLIVRQYGTALATVDRVLRQDPQNAQGYFMLGMVAKEQGKDNEAVNAFQKAVDLDASNVDAFIELGNMYTAKGNNLAIKYYDNALLIDSTNAQALMAKAYFLQSKNRLNDAADIYKSIISREPSNVDATFNLGLMYFDSDSLDRANDCFNIVLRNKATYFKAYYYTGAIKEKRGDKAGALKDYKQCLEFNSGYEKAIEGVKRLGGKI